MTIKRATVDEFSCCGKVKLRALHDTERHEIELYGESRILETTLVEQPASLLVEGEWICMDCARERGFLE